jgi:hypothetical protein
MSKIKFNVNPSTGTRVIPRRRRTNTTKLIVAFRKFTEAPQTVRTSDASSSRSLLTVYIQILAEPIDFTWLSKRKVIPKYIDFLWTCLLLSSCVFISLTPLVLAFIQSGHAMVLAVCHLLPLLCDFHLTVSCFGGLEVACWPLVPKFAGSHPAEAFGFLGRKNPQHAFLRRGSKTVGPCCSFTAYKRFLNVKCKSAFRQNSRTFLAHNSTFRRWVLSHGDTRGDAWW